MTFQMHEQGSGLISPDGSRFLLNIAKNASSFMLDLVSRHGWTAVIKGQEDLAVKEVIVVLRDPVERWVSGVSQYIQTRILSTVGPNGPIYDAAEATAHDYSMTAQDFISQYTDATERLLFDRLDRLDDHVWPQSEFIEGVLVNAPRRYIFMNSQFEQQVADVLGMTILDDLDYHRGADHANIACLQEFFQGIINQRSDLLRRVVRAYRQDYTLINEVCNEMV